MYIQIPIQLFTKYIQSFYSRIQLSVNIQQHYTTFTNQLYREYNVYVYLSRADGSLFNLLQQFCENYLFSILN